MDKYIKCIFLVNNQSTKLRSLTTHFSTHIHHQNELQIFSHGLLLFLFLCLSQPCFWSFLCLYAQMIDTQVVVPIHIRPTVGRSQVWVIHSRELAKPVLVAILRTHLWEKHYPHRYYEHEVQGFGNGFQNQESPYCKGGRHRWNLFAQLCE